MIYIIGGTGKLGRAIASGFAQDHDIKVTERKQDAEVGVDLSVGHQNLLERLNKDDVVLFVAGMSDPSECNERYRELPEIVRSTCEMVRAFSEKCRVFFFSSDVVLRVTAPMGEVADHKEEAYTWSKWKIENDIAGLSNVTVLRLSNVISLDDPILLEVNKSYHANEQFKIFHPYYRNITHVDDLVDCLRYLITCDVSSVEPIVNISGVNNISRKYLYGSLCESLSIPFQVVRRDVSNKIVMQRSKFLPEPQFDPLAWLIEKSPYICGGMK